MTMTVPCEVLALVPRRGPRQCGRPADQFWHDQRSSWAVCPRHHLELTFLHEHGRADQVTFTRTSRPTSTDDFNQLSLLPPEEVAPS